MSFAGSIETGIYSKLAADIDVAALVSTRIYPLFVRTQLRPAIVYQRIATEREYTLRGNSSLANARIQITSWADTYSESKAVGNAVRKALLTMSGTYGDFDVKGIKLIEEDDQFDQESEVAGSKGRFGCRQDFEVTYAEEAA